MADNNVKNYFEQPIAEGDNKFVCDGSVSFNASEEQGGAAIVINDGQPTQAAIGTYLTSSEVSAYFTLRPPQDTASACCVMGGGDSSAWPGGELTTGSKNSFFGNYAGANVADGRDNTLLGYSAGTVLTSGINNTCIGSSSAFRLTTGDGNVMVGVGTGGHLTTGDENTLVGNDCFDGSTLAAMKENVALGHNVMRSVAAPSDSNTALGHKVANTASGSCSENTLIGGGIAATLNAGDNNIVIGHAVDVPAASTSDYLNIGNIIQGDIALDQVAIGRMAAVAFTGSASLELAQTGKVLLLNRIDSTAEAALTLVNGMVWYNSTTNQFRGYKNGALVSFDTTP